MQIDPNDSDLLLLSPDHETRLKSLTPATDWYACYKQRERWFYMAVPLWAVVSIKPIVGSKRQSLPRLSAFGVHEVLGGLERMDIGADFMGYAHASDFEEVGVSLHSGPIERLEAGEIMCGDPQRFMPGSQP